MDVKYLISEVAKRHHLVLGSDDPILATLTLNELILSHYIQQVQVSIEEVQVQMAATSVQQMESAKEKTSQVMTDAARYLVAQMQETGNALQAQLLEAVQKTLENNHQQVQAVSKAQNIAIGAAITSGITACFVIGIALAIIFHH